MSDTLTHAPIADQIIAAIAPHTDLPQVAKDALTEHAAEFARTLDVAEYTTLSRGLQFDQIVRFLAGKGVDTSGWNDYRARVEPAMYPIEGLLVAAKVALTTPEGWRVPLADEPLALGQRVRLVHPLKTAGGGSVYFGEDTTEGTIISYGYGPESRDQRIARDGGSGPADQTVGRQYLLVEDSTVVPGTTDFPLPPSDFRNFHQSTIAALKTWVEDGVADVATGVDAQMVAWSEKGIWIDDACGTTGGAKDWVSAVMRLKCERLGVAFPVVEEPTWTPPTEAEYNRLMERLDRLTAWQTKAIADSDTISEVYNSEADRRNWCSEADEITEAINGRLQVLSLKTRERDVDVTVSGYVRVPFTYTVSVSVTSDDDAEEKAADYFSDNISVSDIRNYGNLDWYSADTEDDLEFELA